MEYSDAEIVYLVEQTPWWHKFYKTNNRIPTVHEMRARLASNEKESFYDDKDLLILKLEKEIEDLKAEVKLLKTEINSLKNK